MEYHQIFVEMEQIVIMKYNLPRSRFYQPTSPKIGSPQKKWCPRVTNAINKLHTRHHSTHQCDPSGSSITSCLGTSGESLKAVEGKSLELDLFLLDFLFPRTCTSAYPSLFLIIKSFRNSIYPIFKHVQMLNIMNSMGTQSVPEIETSRKQKESRLPCF